MRVGRALLSVGLSLAQLSCGGSGGSVPPPPPSGWVVIDAPASTDTVCNELGLSGEAFISPTDWHCCGGSAVEMTAVTVTWRNETSGAAGTASQSVKTSPFLGLYGHTWSATVPLVPGTNRIAVTATDTAGLAGTARLDIRKTGPSFALSGRVLSDGGLWGLGYAESGVSVALAGPASATALPMSGAARGDYALSCLPPGRYAVTPRSGPFGFAFQPASRTVDIVSADVGGVDFQAPAHRLSGGVSWAGSGLPSTADWITVGAGAASLVRAVDALGAYGFVLPDGAYTVTPSDPLCLGCSYTPSQRDVQLQGADQAGLDFLRQ